LSVQSLIIAHNRPISTYVKTYIILVGKYEEGRRRE